MKLLITGASGFIGRYAVKAAIDRGWEVDSIDLRAHGPRALDVRLLQRIECDAVLHLAAYSSNAGFSDNLSENYANNVFGLWNVLRLAQQCGARVVYASSSAVYANQGTRVGRTEAEFDCNVVQWEGQGLWPNVASHYAKSKLTNELMAASFPNALGLRIFNAYGSGDELKRHKAPVTQMQIAKGAGEPFICYGDGTQAKDFIHVSDVVEIIMRLIESPATGIVNVGTGVATSFNELMPMCGLHYYLASDTRIGACGVCGKGGDAGPHMKFSPVPDPASYQYFTRADATRLLSIIGPYQFKTLEEGIKLP